MAHTPYLPRINYSASTESSPAIEEIAARSSMISETSNLHARTRNRKHRKHKATKVLDVGVAASTTQTPPSATTSSTGAPSCPSGNGTTYADSFNIAYEVYCGRDYSFVTNNAFQVNSGGYAQCFAACSTADDCAGFSFNGLDSGTCFLKGHVPDSTRTFRGKQWVSCAKIDPNASASNHTTTSTNSKPTHTHISTSSVTAGTSARKSPIASATHNPYPLPSPTEANPDRTSNVGAIVGGTLGALFAFACIVVIAWFTRRRRNNKNRGDKETKPTPKISAPQSPATLTSFGPAASPPFNSHFSPTMPPPSLPSQSLQSLPSSVYSAPAPTKLQPTPRPESLTRDIVQMLHEPTFSDRRTLQPAPRSPKFREDFGGGGGGKDTYRGARENWDTDSPILPPSKFHGQDRQDGRRKGLDDVRQNAYLHPRGYF